MGGLPPPPHSAASNRVRGPDPPPQLAQVASEGQGQPRGGYRAICERSRSIPLFDCFGCCSVGAFDCLGKASRKRKALNHPEDLWTRPFYPALVNTFGHGVSSKTVIRRGGATAVRCRASALVLRTTDRMACRAMPAIARFLSTRPSAKPETNRLARLPIHARRAYIERGITLISGRGKA